MSKKTVFKNINGDHIIFTDTKAEKISRAFMGWMYYFSYGMPMSLVLGVTFYIGCIWIGTSGHTNTLSDAFIFCIGARTIWHHISFENSLTSHLKKLGFAQTNNPDIDKMGFSAWLEEKLKYDPNLTFHKKSDGCIVLMKGNDVQMLFTVKQ